MFLKNSFRTLVSKGYHVCIFPHLYFTTTYLGILSYKLYSPQSFLFFIILLILFEFAISLCFQIMHTDTSLINKSPSLKLSRLLNKISSFRSYIFLPGNFYCCFIQVFILFLTNSLTQSIYFLLLAYH
jgi:hypothetical protein